VARADVNDSCIWSLNETEEKTIEVSGAADVDLGCGMLANSNDPDGIYKGGSGCLVASEYKVVGGVDDDSNSGCALSPTPETNVPPADDPLASLPSPSYVTCTPAESGGMTTFIGPGPHTIPAGRHCKSILINTTGTLTFEAGTHIFDGAGLTVNGGTIGGSELTLYFSENGGTPDGIDISGATAVNLSAPTSGVYAGILVYQDRATTANITHKMTGGASLNLDGIIYAPSTNVEFTGGSASDSSSIVIIADKVKIGGGNAAYLGNFDTSSILNNALLLRAMLVE
jgi:hypothetical protein